MAIEIVTLECGCKRLGGGTADGLSLCPRPSLGPPHDDGYLGSTQRVVEREEIAGTVVTDDGRCYAFSEAGALLIAAGLTRL